MNSSTMRFTTKLMCLTALVATLVDPVNSPAAVTGNNGNDSGTVSLLVKSRVPLTEDVVAAIGAHAQRVTYVWPEIDAMALTASPARMADLVADPYVALVEADQQASVPNDDPSLSEGAPETTRVVVPLFTSSVPIQTWNQDMADTPNATYDGTGVTVAVVDSGLPQNWEEFLPAGSVDLQHAAGFGAEGWGDYHNPVNAVRGVGGHVGLFPHGLAVSSVIVGFPSAFGPIGGAAPGAKILPIRVLNQFNFGWFSWFTAGILHVGNLKASGAVTGPMVINFSIQATGSSAILTDAINYAIAQGALFVTIAGNYGPGSGSISFPGRLPQSITAGAVGWKREGLPPSPWFFGDVAENDATQAYVATFSGREACNPPVIPCSLIDVVAPGSFVFGEWLVGPGFSEGREVAFDAVDNFIFGTSFSAPHVAGVVAQMLQKNASLTQGQAESILRTSALPMPGSALPFSTPLGVFVNPWGSNATGAGLARGGAAVGLTP